MTFLVLNPSSGISGNMLLAALLDLGADEGKLGGVIEETARVCGCDISFKKEVVKRSGLRALWCDTEIQGDCTTSHGSIFSKKVSLIMNIKLTGTLSRVKPRTEESE